MTVRHEPGVWFKSSWSPDKSECVEVKFGERVGVRDSKDEAGGDLIVDRCSWSALITVVKRS